jgi:osmotically-inducible protein OsmY
MLSVLAAGFASIARILTVVSAVGVSPTRQSLQPEAIGAVMEVTKWLKPSISVSRIGGVTNSIEIKPRVTPMEIRRKIEDALRRAAEIDASRVTVEADGGEVILRGTVRSWAEREEAERVAWAAPGVTKVDNRITVTL